MRTESADLRRVSCLAGAIANLQNAIGKILGHCLDSYHLQATGCWSALRSHGIPL